MVILGVAPGHNCSAALMIDGRVVAVIQEERFTKIKNQTGHPARAINSLVQTYLGGDFNKIDLLSVGGAHLSPYWIAIDHYCDHSVHDWVKEMHDYWHPYFYGDRQSVKDYWIDLNRSGTKSNRNHNYDMDFLLTMTPEDAQLHFTEIERFEAYRRCHGWLGNNVVIDHHTSHAYYALHGGTLTEDQKKRALVLTADSNGDGFNWTASTCDDGLTLKELGRGNQHLVARIYKFGTLILGMKPNEHEYKVMGLAPYARYRREIDRAVAILRETLDFRDGEFVSDRPLVDCYFDLKARLEGVRFDIIAAALQDWSTDVTRAWAHHWLRETGKDVLCFSGGLSMNIRTCGTLLELPEVSTLCVPASGGDESLSIGAAYAAAALHGDRVIHSLGHVYLGGSPEDDWAARLSETSMTVDDFTVLEDVGAQDGAKLLAADFIIARCVGPAEFGARALGNRSILANPSNADNIAKINTAIKNRDFWMPFTPSILAEHADTLLVNPKGVASPFMTIGFDTKPEARTLIPAGLHPADRSARPQYVYRETNAEYWDLIESFRQLTGIPGVLNTSLNLHGEPMNYGLADAARTVALSGLEVLLMPGNRLLVKNASLDAVRACIGRA